MTQRRFADHHGYMSFSRPQLQTETEQIAVPRSEYPYARTDARCHMEFAHGGHPWGIEPNGSHLPNWCDGAPVITPASSRGSDD